MSNYHLTQEQIAQLLEAKGYHGESFKLVPKMTDIVNAALDQVLGEPVAWAEKGRENNVIADLVKQTNKNDWVKPYTVALYAPKESVLGSLEQQPDGSVHFEEYKP